MPYQFKKRNRRTLRLRGYEYSRPGSYFVTICTFDHQCYFGHINDNEMHLNRNGQVAETIWRSLVERFPGVELDQYVIMPNHVHGIIVIVETSAVISQNANIMNMPPRFQSGWNNHYPTEPELYCAPLGEIVRTCKAATTYCVHKGGEAKFAWQERYYESIIPDERDLHRLRLYILNNPAKWERASLYGP